jgi:hypothetical protein
MIQITSMDRHQFIKRYENINDEDFDRLMTILKKELSNMGDFDVVELRHFPQADIRKIKDAWNK